MLLAACALWVAVPAASQAQTHGCACLFNQAGAPIQFQYKWGDAAFQTRTLQAGMVYSFCWRYEPGSHSSPPLHFMLNRAVGGGTAFTDYALPRVQSNTTQCTEVPAAGLYHVTFQPGTNNQFLHVVKGRGTAAAAPPPHAPPPGPGPAPNTRVHACACLHNNVGRWLTFQYAFGAEPLNVLSERLQARYQYSFGVAS